MVLNFKRKTPELTIAEGQHNVAAPDYSAAIKQLAQSAASMGKEAAELCGVLDDVNQAARRQSESFRALSADVQQMVRRNQGIVGSVEATTTSAQQARGAVERVASDVSSAAETLREVAAAAGEITRIALQIRLVAFNASVEAKRAGDAGHGFGVVADAVRRSGAAGRVIEQAQCRHRQATGWAHRRTRAEHPQRRVARWHADVQQRVFAGRRGDRLDRRGGAGKPECLRADARFGRTSGCGSGLVERGDRLRARGETFLKTSERLIGLGADCGAETDDTPFIERVMQMASDVGRIFEQAIEAGGIDAAALFDDRYVPIAGTDP